MLSPNLAPDERTAARLGCPSCPSCGAIALSPAHSQFVSEQVVQHCWACEDCGYLFVSRVGVLERAEVATCQDETGRY